jgi:hypothetical protein
VVDVSVIRAEDDGVLVGGESVAATAAYIAVVRADVARTETGIGVGSHRRDLVTAMGPELVDSRFVRDPGLLAFASLPGARFVVVDDRVGAVLLRRRDPAEPAAGRPSHEPASDTCGGGPRSEAAITASGLRGQSPRSMPICFSAAGEIAVITDGTLAVVAGEGDRARRVASLDVRGLRFASAVRVDAGRDELVVVTERSSDSERVVAVALYRLEAGKLVRSAEQDVYRIAATSAGWIGARLANLDLMLEIEARADALIIGGALVHRQDGLVRDLAPLEPVRLSRRRKPTPVDATPVSPGHDAGPPDAGDGPDAAAP